jgi:hypothetical protein
LLQRWLEEASNWKRLPLISRAARRDLRRRDTTTVEASCLRLFWAEHADETSTMLWPGSYNWDEREDRAYRHYMEERHEQYRKYDKLKEKEQRDYWNWRHSHPD